MTAQTDNHFARLWALGYQRLCPIVPPDAPLSERSSLYRRLHAPKNPTDERGKAPGVKWPDGSWSGFDFVKHESTEDDVARWHAMGAGVGIKTGHGLVLIDADTLDEAHAMTIRDAVWAHCGKLPVRVGRYPKAGYLLRTDDDFRYCRVEFGARDENGRTPNRVEILSEGRQFVAHGVHPVTAKPYHWPQGTPARADLPFVSGERLLGLLDALTGLLPAAQPVRKEGGTGDVDQSALLGDWALIEKAVNATPNTSDLFPTRDAWRDYAYAIKAAAGPDREADALGLLQDWSERWVDGENDPEWVEAEWGRMKPPFRRGVGWLCELAAEHGAPGEFSSAERWFEPIGDDAPLFPESAPNAFGAPADSGKRFSFTPFDAAAADALTSAAAPLIKGVLDQGAMTVLYGESNAGKTFVAMDMAYHIARGLEWSGRRVARLPVLYIAAEGGKGARKRAGALASRYGAADGFWFLMHPINLLRADADLRPLLASVAACGVRFGLIVVDTLSRAMAGGDENASTDMGAMVRHLDALRSATGAHLMAVHHSGKDRAKGARGHSLLRAATDTEIEVADRVISVTKQRDLDGGFERAFSLDVVTLGVDADGDPVTSCVVKLGVVEPGEAVRGEPTEAEARVAGAISELESFAKDGAAEGISVAEVVEFFDATADKLSENSARHHMKRLVAKGILTKCLRGRWKTVVAESGQAIWPNIFE